ncbi:MAG: photosystem reaction center subunit H [Methanocalculus sp. MSAO_Arc1]|uniref:PRC-barrel domain-containing protein n=1 Tax=Methanocalculus TaxID=71151 RepID=UPI000FEDD289|nr:MULTISPECIES: PRC-barrel domain-containing protein [unclassified Methanocalculus]MCP1662204.1 sporulation protein YlmC with PRC-barrel domain [Methanocalculus sp. AMF5]RQD81662.1 MAG: photosystem reaction center subunit H [Methanocalculus sp. MSAO_Arc1]
MKWQISELFGMSVYTDRAVYIGNVEDVVIDIDNKKMASLAVANINSDIIDLKSFKGVKIPYRLIKEVSDIVLIRHIPGAFKTSAVTDPEE